MRWVLINRAYFNIDHIQTFYWTAGNLSIWLQGEETAEVYDDPHRENYLRLCHNVGVRPLEEDGHGQG